MGFEEDFMGRMHFLSPIQHFKAMNEKLNNEN